MIDIDKGVPMPETRGRPVRYPFESMEVGDSFFCSGGTMRTTRTRTSEASRRLAPKRFSARAVEENGVKGIRVWRVA